MTPDYALGFAFYKAEIDAGRPLVVVFRYRALAAPHIAVTDPETGETIDVFYWGNPVGGSGDPNPEEQWYPKMGIGHAVTGVGYILNWDPDGAGLLPLGNYVIVHDTWVTTPKNVAVFWPGAWISSHAVVP